jgi:peptidoglycan/xylan/chitin deacetylase (PgdA/CDA1 family)
VLLAITYHYVAEQEPENPRAIFPITATQLAAQLELVGRTFEFVSRDEVVDAVLGGRALPERACLVTFDDGLRCQYELALPVLERLGVPALFFVAAAPIASGRTLAVHKIHRLREAVSDDVILAELGRDPPVPPRGKHAYDDPDAAAVKELLAATPTRKLDALLAAAGATVGADLYMSVDQLAALERRSGLGAHGYSHRPLAALGPDGAREDLERGAAVLELATGRRPRVVSYPYGTPDAVDAATAEAAAQAGFVAGFTMRRGLNLDLATPLLMARLDTRDLENRRIAGLDLDA